MPIVILEVLRVIVEVKIALGKIARADVRMIVDVVMIEIAATLREAEILNSVEQ